VGLVQLETRSCYRLLHTDSLQPLRYTRSSLRVAVTYRSLSLAVACRLRSFSLMQLTKRLQKGELKLYTLANINTNPNPNPMRHCGRGSGCTQHYLNYDAKVYNSSLPYKNKQSEVNSVHVPSCYKSRQKAGNQEMRGAHVPTNTGHCSGAGMPHSQRSA